MSEVRNRYGKRTCACCGYFTIEKEWDICEVCFWEDNWYQVEHPSDCGGPNQVCIAEAKKNFSQYGACDLHAKQFVRLPVSDEFPMED